MSKRFDLSTRIISYFSINNWFIFVQNMVQSCFALKMMRNVFPNSERRKWEEEAGAVSTASRTVYVLWCIILTGRSTNAVHSGLAQEFRPRLQLMISLYLICGFLCYALSLRSSGFFRTFSVYFISLYLSLPLFYFSACSALPVLLSECLPSPQREPSGWRADYCRQWRQRRGRVTSHFL